MDSDLAMAAEWYAIHRTRYWRSRVDQILAGWSFYGAQHHYCDEASEDLAQCVVFDLNTAEAQIIARSCVLHRREVRRSLSPFLAKRLKSLRGLTPFERTCQLRTEQPQRFRLNPLHHMPGLNTPLEHPCLESKPVWASPSR